MRRAILPVLAIVVLAAAPNAHAATTTVRYGPFTIPAASGMVPGTMSTVKLAVARPCVACFITSFQPNLVYRDGSTANLDSGAMLHHGVWSSQLRPDATCSGTPLGLAGQRFFATGNERTTISLPPGYGYRVRWYDVWHMLVDLMNMTPSTKTVYVAVTYSYRWPWESVRGVTPIWLDIDQCGDSQYRIPEGPSDSHWDWSVNVPGKVVAAAGHVHGYGIAVEATNESKGGASICKSVATPHPDDVHAVMSMSTCSGDPLAVIQQGDVVRLHSMYESPHEADDVMGIMLMYVYPS
jgi:hypothetical protein